MRGRDSDLNGDLIKDRNEQGGGSSIGSEFGKKDHEGHHGPNHENERPSRSEVIEMPRKEATGTRLFQNRSVRTSDHRRVPRQRTP